MSTKQSKRRFALRDGTRETSVFTGTYPRQAAMKAARRLSSSATSEGQAKRRSSEIKLREHGTDKVHVYDAWAWTESAPTDSPDWLGETVSKANVAKKHIEHLDG